MKSKDKNIQEIAVMIITIEEFIISYCLDGWSQQERTADLATREE
jgi:hypothetical protein